ncbi:hypothetical protein AO377_1194 [Moraxella catarrhalis]|uniref:hypothetical protein n=1 Tax=Moraxella catarrhalis TaxID=480 RepID=UPI0007E2F121|nr:hypothetical protein [Moraxella catarrhalis]OAV09733.1 hypothetical protein AO377_1194 [Moraxella catarrhalis]OAV17962.1 hypothetical protein AO375_0182 [Moraxella catarrhalis]
MIYNYDLTGIDDCFFSPDYGIINNYLSLKLYDKKVSIDVENMEIYISDPDILDSHKMNYPDSILSKIDCQDDCWCFLKNLLIDFCEVKMIAIEIMIDDKEYYHTIGNFSVGDKAFFMHGYSSNYTKAKLRIFIVYSSKMEISFHENDIVPITLNFEEFLTKKEIENINEEMRLSIKSQDIDFSIINSIKSAFFDVDYFLNYFKDSFAIKDYYGDKDIDKIYSFSL